MYKPTKHSDYVTQTEISDGYCETVHISIKVHKIVEHGLAFQMNFVDNVEPPSWFERKFTKTKTLEEKVVESHRNLMKQAHEYIDFLVKRNELINNVKKSISE